MPNPLLKINIKQQYMPPRGPKLVYDISVRVSPYIWVCSFLKELAILLFFKKSHKIIGTDYRLDFWLDKLRKL